MHKARHSCPCASEGCVRVRPVFSCQSWLSELSLSIEIWAVTATFPMAGVTTMQQQERAGSALVLLSPLAFLLGITEEPALIEPRHGLEAGRVVLAVRLEDALGAPLRRAQRAGASAGAGAGMGTGAGSLLSPPRSPEEEDAAEAKQQSDCDWAADSFECAVLVGQPAFIHVAISRLVGLSPALAGAHGLELRFSLCPPGASAPLSFVARPDAPAVDNGASAVNQAVSFSAKIPVKMGQALQSWLSVESLELELWADAPKARDVTSGEATSREPQNGHDAGEQARLERLQEERDALEEEVLKLRSRRTFICSLM